MKMRQLQPQWARRGEMPRSESRKPGCADSVHPLKKYISAIWKTYKLLLPDRYRLQQFEIERRLRVQGNVAIAGESRTAGTRRCADQGANGSALSAAGDCPDGRAPCRATAHHGCRALAFSFAGHGCTGRLNLMILPVDLDAGELESQRSAAFEAAGGLCLSHNALCTSALRNGDL